MMFLAMVTGMANPMPWNPPVLEAIVPKIRAAQATVRSLGGRIVVGSDAGIGPAKPHDVAPHAIHNLLGIGMTPLEALSAMTSGGADAVGLPAKGRVARGADADLVAVAGDPSADPDALTKIVQVWKAGKPIHNSRL